MSKDERPDVDQAHPLLEFPEGDGDPNCPDCLGRGVISLTSSFYGIHWPGGATQSCKCVYKRELEANVQRIWPVLANVESAPSSPLLRLTGQNLWITASGYDLRQHLRYTAYRMPANWDAKVITDSKIITSWLANANEVYDPDVAYEKQQTSLEFFTIEDIAVPFGLLIIVLGVKAAKNREMPNVLLEAINEREMRGKPTWVVDSPHNPLAPGHICYNESVMEMLDSFRRVVLSKGTSQVRTPATAQTPIPGQAPGAAQNHPANPYMKRKPGTLAGMETPHYKPPPPPPAPPKGNPSQYADDDISVEAMLGSALDLTPQDIRAHAPVLPYDDDEETVAALFESDEEPDYLDEAKAAMEKPKPQGRRAFRPFGDF